MKFILTLTIALTLSCYVCAQSSGGAPTMSDLENEEPIHVVMVEQKPSFPGGDADMYKWLGANINYPAEAAKEGISGRVTVRYVIEKDGSITDVKVVRGKHPALDAEAVRVVKAMPNWIPGKVNGENVRVTYVMPVTFSLN